MSGRVSYDAELVDRVRKLYESGLTQHEVSAVVGVTQKVVFSLMRKHNIRARPAIKRDQRGPKNDSWKGDKVGYGHLHRRVELAIGKPRRCEQCGTTTAKRYEWANLTGKYEDVFDYKRLCVSCHHTMDGTVANFKGLARTPKFSAQMAEQIRIEKASGATAKSLCEKHGVSITTLRRVMRKEGAYD